MIRSSNDIAGTKSLRAHLPELVIVALFLATAGFLRLRDLNRFIASDELRWACRSISFHAALDKGDLAETFQIGHPGVLTMWTGTLALQLEDAGEWLELCEQTNGGTQLRIYQDEETRGEVLSIVPLLWRMRRGVAVGTTVMLALIYLLLRAGLGLRMGASLGGLALLATDPFTLAHSRVLHVDALLASSATAAVLGLAWAFTRDDQDLEGSSRSPGRLSPSLRRWGLAGALAGVAMLAKSAGFVLGPFAIGCAVLWAWLRRDVAGGARRFLAWGLAAALAYALLWPAMWVDPVGTLFRDCDEPCHAGVLVKLLDEGGVPHQTGNYFLGQPVADPGAAFYPAVILFRSTPWSLLGILAAVWLSLLAIRGSRFPGKRTSKAIAQEPEARTAAWASWARSPSTGRGLAFLLAWAIFFLVFLSLGPKKMDRYLLPALMPLNLVAGIALVSLASAFVGKMRSTGDGRNRRLLGMPLGTTFALLLLAIGLLEALSPRAWPYPLTYYNPALGGASAAERVLLVGWGEGFDLATEYLNGLPNPEDIVTSTPGKANTAPLFLGRTRSLEGFEPGRTDYVIFYRSQVQRRKPAADEQNPHLLAMYHDDPTVEPVFTGVINGLEMVWVYRNHSIAPLEARLEDLSRSGDILLAGGETVLARHYQGPMPLHRYWGHWFEADIETELLPELDEDWERAWVVRYPHYDPEATLNVLSTIAERGETERIEFADGSAVEITLFTREAE